MATFVPRETPIVDLSGMLIDRNFQGSKFRILVTLRVSFRPFFGSLIAGFAMTISVFIQITEHTEHLCLLHVVYFRGQNMVVLNPHW